MHAVATSWLAHQCGIIPGSAVGVLLLSDKQDSTAVAAVWPRKTDPPKPVLALAGQALAKRCAVADSATDENGNRYTLVAVPLRIRETLWAAVAVAVSANVPESQRRALELLTDGGQWLAWLLAQGSPAAVNSQPSAEPEDLMHGVLELVEVSVDAESFDAAAFSIVTEIASKFGCERVSLGILERNAIRVCALSHSARFDTRSSLVRAIQFAMEEAADVQGSIRFPPAKGGRPTPCRAHEKLVAEHGSGSVCSIPLSRRSQIVGALTLEYSAGRLPTDRSIAFCEECGPLLGAILEEKWIAERWIGRKLLDSLREGLEDLLGPRRPALKGIAAASLVAFLLLAFIPVTHRISSPATLEGRVQRAVVAPVAGFIAESRARAGDVVREGEVLASLDDADLQLEFRKWTGRRTELQKEYRAAVAGHDRSEANILRAQLGQAEAESRLVREQLSRMRLVAPFAGIVARGDLSQSLGSPVERGQVLFEVAPLDDYRIILEIDERDISSVWAGQSGRLSLAALPGEIFELAVQRIIPVSTSQEGRNFFRAEARVESPPKLLRPGMEGVAKVEVGHRSLLWIWTHSAIDWMRLWLWSKVF